MLIANFGKYTIVVITFLIVLSTLGLNLTSLAVVAGALSVGIGFGLQNIVNNFVSGIILLIEKSIRIGDLIEVSDAVVGRVQEIRLRSTIITTFDNVELVVPNSELVQNRIVNRTLTSGVRRLRMPFGVAYGTDVEQVRSAILSAVAQSSLRCYSDEEKKPDVWMTGLGASSVDYALLVWIDAEQPDPPLPSDFYILIYNALNAAKIPIPFPQLDVHMTREQ
jgi:small-conductance mechanosensitive channel